MTWIIYFQNCYISEDEIHMKSIKAENKKKKTVLRLVGRRHGFWRTFFLPASIFSSSLCWRVLHLLWLPPTKLPEVPESRMLSGIQIPLDWSDGKMTGQIKWYPYRLLGILSEAKGLIVKVISIFSYKLQNWFRSNRAYLLLGMPCHSSIRLENSLLKSKSVYINLKKIT